MELAKLLSVLGYLAVLVGIGVVASRRVKDAKDYFAAGKQLGFWSVAFSARATGESAWLLLGLTGMGAAIGFKAMWVVVGEVLGVGAAWLLMSRRFKRLTDKYDAITIPDYLEARFRDEGTQRLRLVAAFALCVFVTIYVSAQIDATGKAFESFLGWNYYVGALVGFSIVVLYSASGGFLAVAWSDVFQGALMFAGLVFLPIAGLWVAGGWAPVASALPDSMLTWHAGEGWTATTIATCIGFVAIGVGFMGSPQIFVRFLALRDEGEINKGAAVAIVWTLLADSGAVLAGMIGRALMTADGVPWAAFGASGENVLPMLVEWMLPAALVGLYIAIVLSAIMSTIDSLLVLAASALVRDVYQKIRRPDIPDSALVPMSRAGTIGLALVALALALTVATLSPTRSIFWFVIFGWSGIAASFVPVTVLSLFWGRMTRRGAIAAMVSGFLAVPFFKFVGPDLPVVGPILEALSELPPAVGLSFLVGIGVSLGDSAGADRLADAALEIKDAGRNDHR